MKSEQKKSNHEKLNKWLKIGLATLAIAYLGIYVPFVQNIDATKRITDNLFHGTPISCPLPTQRDEQKNIVLVAPGAGFYVDDVTGVYVPSSAEKMRLKAMAKVYVDQVKGHPHMKVVIQDGVLPEGMSKDIDIDIFKEDVAAVSQGQVKISDSDIYVDKVSINTSSGMPVLKDIMQEINADEAVFIDSQSHGDRTTEDACEYGIPSSWISAEDIVGQMDPKVDYANNKNLPEGSPTTRLKEKTEMALNIWFPGGWETVPAKNLFNAYKDVRSITNKSSPEYGHGILPIATILIALFTINRSRRNRIKK